MPTYTDIRQTAILALEAQGADSLTIVRQGIREVHDALATLDAMQADGLGPREYLAQQQRLGAELRKLQALEKEITATLNEEVRARIDAIAREERARMDAALAAEEAAGRELRARIDAIAREERMREAATQKAIQQAGEEKRARIDAFVAAELAAERAAAVMLAATEKAKVAAIQASGEAARAYARAESQKEAATREAVAAEEREFAELEKLNQAFRHNAQNVGMATAATREQIQALKDMGIIQDTVNVGARSGAGAFGGFATAAEQAADKQKRLGYAMMNVSYAVQDLQYGMGAVANNIGLVSMSVGNAIPKFASMTAIVGGPAGFGAILMGLGVFADVLYHNWDKVAGLFGGTVPKMVGDTKELEKNLKALEDKKVKAQFDWTDIRVAREELKKLADEEAAYQRLKTGKTEEQQKRGKAVSEAIIEGGGTGDFASGADNVVRAVASSSAIPESAATRYWRLLTEKRRKAGQEQLAKESEGRFLDSKATDAENHRREAQRTVTQAAEGNEQARASLQQTFEANPEKFTSLGIDPLRFGAGLEMASPGLLFEEERRKHREEADKKAEATKKKRDDQAEAARKLADSTRNQQVSDATSRAGPGYDEKLEKDIHDAIKGGTEPGAAMDAQKGALVDALAARGVKADVVAAVAENLLNKAVDAANNLIAEGKKPRLDVKADAAAKRLGTGIRKEDTAEEQAEKARARKLAPGIDPMLEAAIDANRLAQARRDPGAVPEANLAARLHAQVSKTLRASGQDGALAGPLVADAFAKATDRYTAALAQTGNQVAALLQLVEADMVQLHHLQSKALANDMAISNLFRRQGNQRRGPNKQNGIR